VINAQEAIVTKDERRQKLKERFSKGIDNTSSEGIMPRPLHSIFTDGEKRKVAIYMRVAHDDGLMSSFEMQELYYKDFLSKHENLQIVAMYSDVGSGASTASRVQFKKMIEDCETGELGIELIIVRSVSRFHRNAAELFMITNKLAKLRKPVGVYFEMENIYTLDDAHIRSFVSPLCPFTWDRRKHKCKTT
jgi:hypothetical protein